jgi:hypothetical protein
MPACSLRKKVSFDCEISSAAASSGQAFDNSAAASGPDTSNSFMCEISNSPACSRVWRCSFITPAG